MQNHLKGLVAFVVFLFLCAPAGADTHSTAEKDWNLLVFINGVNNLDYFGGMNINQMEQIGSNARLNILVQWGSHADPNVKRLLVHRDNEPNRVTSPVVKNLGSADMGDWRQLVDFATWAHRNYPAKKTFLVVWNHGSGWRRVEGVSPSDISLDDRTGNIITTEELGHAMGEIARAMGRKIDIYGSDACLMGMVEVADEMAESVEYFVGSQDLEPGQGWPYNTFLTRWMASGDLSAADVSRVLTEEFLTAYSGGIYGRASVTLSAFDMSHLGAYKQAVRELSDEIRAQPTSQLSKIKSATTRSKTFYNSDYVDMIDFLDRISSLGVSLTKAAAVRDIHQDLVFANAQNQDTRTHGLSVWVPAAATFSEHWGRYEKLQFNRATGWGHAMKRVLGK